MKNFNIKLFTFAGFCFGLSQINPTYAAEANIDTRWMDNILLDETQRSNIERPLQEKIAGIDSKIKEYSNLLSGLSSERIGLAKKINVFKLNEIETIKRLLSYMRQYAHMCLSGWGNIVNKFSKEYLEKLTQWEYSNYLPINKSRNNKEYKTFKDEVKPITDYMFFVNDFMLDFEKQWNQMLFDGIPNSDKFKQCGIKVIDEIKKTSDELYEKEFAKLVKEINKNSLRISTYDVNKLLAYIIQLQKPVIEFHKVLTKVKDEINNKKHSFPHEKKEWTVFFTNRTLKISGYIDEQWGFHTSWILDDLLGKLAQTISSPKALVIGLLADYADGVNNLKNGNTSSPKYVDSLDLFSNSICLYYVITTSCWQYLPTDSDKQAFNNFTKAYTEFVTEYPTKELFTGTSHA